MRLSVLQIRVSSMKHETPLKFYLIIPHIKIIAIKPFHKLLNYSLINTEEEEINVKQNLCDLRFSWH
jgi:hypothetical protein